MRSSPTPDEAALRRQKRAAFAPPSLLRSGGHSWARGRRCRPAPYPLTGVRPPDPGPRRVPHRHPAVMNPIGGSRALASHHRAALGVRPNPRLPGCPGVCLSTAEEEVGLARIADWPVALILVELEQRAALPDRDDVLD